MFTRRDGLKLALAAPQDRPLVKGVQRANYLAAWWNTVNWDRAAANFAKAPA
jgi:hypothetical protein